MHYPDLHPRWDRIIGVGVWLAAAFALLDPMFGVFVGDCISVQCTPSLEVRLVGLALTALIIAALPALAIAKVIRRLVTQPDQ